MKIHNPPLTPVPAAREAPAAVVDMKASAVFDRLADTVELGASRELAEIAKLGQELFERPPAADVGLGAGASPLDRLGAAPDDDRQDDLLDVSGAPSGSGSSGGRRSGADALRPSTNLRDHAAGVASSDPEKQVRPVPGQTTTEKTEDGRTSRTRTVYTDGSVVRDQRSIDDDGTVSRVRTRDRVDGSSSADTVVVHPSGRWFRTHEQTDENGHTTGRFEGDRSLYYSWMTRERGGVEEMPRDDQVDATLLPPWVEIEVGSVPTDDDRVLPSREVEVGPAPRLRIDREALVSDPDARPGPSRPVPRERLGPIDRQRHVLPPRPGATDDAAG